MKDGILYVIIGLFICSCKPDAGHREQKPDSNVPLVTEIDSIRFATGGCEGTCPVYTLVLSADNSARFEGGAFSHKTGTYKADLLRLPFRTVASFIDLNRIDTLRAEYNDGAMDVQNAMLYIYYKSGKTKQIVDMQMAGTPSLIKLYGMMQQIADSANWIKQ